MILIRLNRLGHFAQLDEKQKPLIATKLDGHKIHVSPDDFHYVAFLNDGITAQEAVDAYRAALAKAPGIKGTMLFNYQAGT